VWVGVGWVVWAVSAVKNISFFCLVLGPEEIFYSIFASIDERRSILCMFMSVVSMDAARMY